MERDCMISHGASRFTKDRIYYASDKFEVFSCKKCGMFAIFNEEKQIHLCKSCDNRTSFNRILLPYSCKLLFQELITMNIAPRIIAQINHKLYLNIKYLNKITNINIFCCYYFLYFILHNCNG